MGIVPGTVLAVIRIGIRRWTISANLGPIPTVTGGGNRKRTCGQVPAVTDYPTCRPNRIAARRLSCSAIRRGTCRRTAEVTWTVLCGLSSKAAVRVSVGSGVPASGVPACRRSRAVPPGGGDSSGCVPAAPCPFLRPSAPLSVKQWFPLPRPHSPGIFHEN